MDDSGIVVADLAVLLDSRSLTLPIYAIRYIKLVYIRRLYNRVYIC